MRFENKWDRKENQTPIRVHPKSLKQTTPLLQVPANILNTLPLVQKGDLVFEYLQERKIELEFIQKYQLRSYRNSAIGRLGVVFPIITKAGTVVDLYVRSISSKIFFRLNAELTGSGVNYHAPHLVFGCQYIARNKPLWIVEGPIDALRLATLGVSNVVAVCGGPKKAQIANIYAPRGIVVAFDDDEAGSVFAQQLIKRSSAKTFYVVKWGLVGCKDAGDLESREQLEEVVRQRKIYIK
jgi:hypothetical protein